MSCIAHLKYVVLLIAFGTDQEKIVATTAELSSLKNDGESVRLNLWTTILMLCAALAQTNEAEAVRIAFQGEIVELKDKLSDENRNSKWLLDPGSIKS